MRAPTDTRPLRPNILDFLTKCRDLQDLEKASPRDLYATILAMPIKKQTTTTPDRRAKGRPRLPSTNIDRSFPRKCVSG